MRERKSYEVLFLKKRVDRCLKTNVADVRPCSESCRIFDYEPCLVTTNADYYIHIA